MNESYSGMPFPYKLKIRPRKDMEGYVATLEECPYCGKNTAVILTCPGCGREGCENCMPAGNGCMCPECEE